MMGGYSLVPGLSPDISRYWNAIELQGNMVCISEGYTQGIVLFNNCIATSEVYSQYNESN